jgi:hypothetical protein
MNDSNSSEYLGKFPDKPATEKQLNLLRDLFRQKSCRINQDITRLTRKQASHLISQMLRE